MLSRTAKNSLSSTPRPSEKGAKLEQTTTITPRERPKAARNTSTNAVPVQRKLIAGKVRDH